MRPEGGDVAEWRMGLDERRHRGDSFAGFFQDARESFGFRLELRGFRGGGFKIGFGIGGGHRVSEGLIR